MVFTGKAVYDTGLFNTLAEDVEPIISMVSPRETPLLDALPQARFAAQNVLHEWLEEKLAPLTLSTSTAVGSTTAASSVQVHDLGTGAGALLQVGTVLYAQATGEYLFVTAISADYLTVSRAQGSSTANSLAAGATLQVVGDAALEGADVSVSTVRVPTRHTNYCQIFKKDIIVSGTVQAVNHIGIDDAFNHEVRKKTIEAMRDLEKSLILGVSLGNTLGSSTAYRTFAGIKAQLTTNVVSLGTLTPALLDAAIKNAWDNGGDDLDLIVCSADWKQLIDTFNGSDRTRVANGENEFVNQITYYESTYGRQRVMLNRYMKPSSLMVLATPRISVVPLQGRSFRAERVAPTGDAVKGMVLGEYTCEVKNQESMLFASAS